MRLSYYEFPKGTPEEVLLENGCAVYWKDGGYSYLDDGIPEEARPYFDHIDHTVQTSVTTAKKLLKQYGGAAYTAHIDRSGTVFENTPIALKGNNSRFKYNHHL